MQSKNVCSKCGKKYKVKPELVFGVKDFLTINYCPKCQEVQATMPPLTAIKGKALRGINKKTGHIRLKGISPEKWIKRDVIVQTFPKWVVTKPSEWKVYSGRRLHKTKERKAKVYPELSRGDEVLVSGFLSEGILYAVTMLNQTIGIATEFVESEINLKKGLFSSFSIRNPILIQSKKKIEKLLEEK